MHIRNSALALHPVASTHQKRTWMNVFVDFMEQLLLLDAEPVTDAMIVVAHG